MKSTERKQLIAWARNCHFDIAICVKEIKGKRWMSVLGWLEAKYDFNLDDIPFHEGWTKILSCLNQLTEKEVRTALYQKRKL